MRVVEYLSTTSLNVISFNYTYVFDLFIAVLFDIPLKVSLVEVNLDLKWSLIKVKNLDSQTFSFSTGNTSVIRLTSYPENVIKFSAD